LEGSRRGIVSAALLNRKTSTVPLYSRAQLENYEGFST
jgi:hypothetical protein